jgi:hypothetical protein
MFTKEQRDKIKKSEVRNCTNCGGKKSYTNPFATCFECKKRFCFDCIYGGQVNDKMGENEEIRKICDKCRIQHDYKNLA